jgi:hypothetical protein
MRGTLLMPFLVENELADAAVRRNAGAGGHYFDRDTMRSFGSRVHEGYDWGDGNTLVIMSNRDRWGSVANGRRHYFLILVDAEGGTSKDVPDERYDVSKGTGYWMSLRAARAAVKRLRN